MRILYIGEETRNWVMRLVNELSLLGNTITVVVKKYDEYDNDNKILPLEGVNVVEVEDDAYFKPDTVDKCIQIAIRTNPERFGASSKDIGTNTHIELSTLYDAVYGSHIVACIPVKYIAERYHIPYGIQVLDIPLDLIEQQDFRKRNWEAYKIILKDCKTMTFIISRARDDWNKLTGQYYPDDNVIHYPFSIPEDYKLSGLDVDDRYIVCFNRLVPQMNVSEATMALARVPSLGVRQVAIGKSQGDLERIQAIAKKYNVKLIHETQVTEVEKFELIKNASALVYPQRSEYLGGLPPQEAMYIGTPAVTFNYDTKRELYKDYAFAANVNESDSFMKELIYVLTVDKKFIRDKLIEASDHVAKNTYANAAKKLNKVMEGMIQ